MQLKLNKNNMKTDNKWDNWLIELFEYNWLIEYKGSYRAEILFNLNSGFNTKHTIKQFLLYLRELNYSL